MTADATADIAVAISRLSEGKDNCPAILAVFLQQNPEYIDVGVENSSGQILCALSRSNRAETPIGPELARHTLNTIEGTISALVTIQGEPLPRLVVLHTLLPSDAEGSIVYASTAFTAAADLATDPIANEARVLIFDVNGHSTELKTGTVHHLHPLSAGELSRLDIPKRLPPAAGPSVVREGSNLIAFVPLGVVGEPDGIMLYVARQDLYREAWLELRRSITLLFVGLLLILVLLWWVSERLIMQPALALTRAADRLAFGDLSTRTGLPSGKSEFSRVALAFDRMAEGIEQRDLANKQQMKKLERADRLHEVLGAINAAIVRRESVTQLMQEICQIACEIGGFRYAWIGAVDSDENALSPVSWAGQRSDDLIGLIPTSPLNAETPLGRGPASSTARTGAAVLTNRFLKDPMTAPWHAIARKFGFASALALPMGVTLKGQRRVLTLCAHEEDYFAAEEIKVLEQLAQDAAFGLHLIATEQVLAENGNHDDVTGLPSERFLMLRMGDAMQQAKTERKQLAICALDVDFQRVVSQWGRQQGHSLFKQLGQEIESFLGVNEMIGVLPGARLAIILGSTDSLDTTALRLTALVDRLLALRVPTAQGSITPSPRVGVAVFPVDGEDSEDLVDKALAALDQVQLDHDGSIKFYAPEIGLALQENRKLTQLLRGALDRGEFVLHYQPIVSLKTGSLCGFEALLRWMHPAMGEVPPDRFIPLAESSGLISAIGEWVVQQVAQQAVAWDHLGASDLFISINVSAIQLRDVHFAERIGLLLSTPGMRSMAIRLAMEVTESHLLLDIEQSIELLNKLRTLGIAIIIDDFGTGYSSLSYLQRLPIDVLKIDKSFTKNLDTDLQDQKMVAGILALAESIGLKTVAEGVERSEQMEVVKGMGCTYGQGFLYDRGLPVDQIQSKWLQGSERSGPDEHLAAS